MTVKTRREEQIKAAHDEAIFGGSTIPPSNSSDNEPEVENDTKESNESSLGTSLISEKVSNFRERTLVQHCRYLISPELHVVGTCQATGFLA